MHLIPIIYKNDLSQHDQWIRMGEKLSCVVLLHIDWWRAGIQYMNCMYPAVSGVER